MCRAARRCSAALLPSIVVPALVSRRNGTKFTTLYRDPLPAELSGRLLELLQKTLWEAEVDMSRLSSNSTITPVERSGHFIQFDRPDAVIHAVQTMVESVQ